MLLQLPNNCYIGKMSVSPANWKKPGASIKKPWVINYRFYDPAHRKKWPKGKQIKVGGMNHIHNLDLRRKETAKIIEVEKDILLNDGWNPITKAYFRPEDIIQDVPSSTPFIIALQNALKRISCCHKYKLNIESTLRYVIPVATQMGYYIIPVSDIRRRHIRMLLDKVGKSKDTWTEATFNNYRKHLLMLFEELLDQEAIEFNPVEKIKKKEAVKKLREVLTKAQRREYDLHLRKKGLQYKKGFRKTGIMRYRIFNRLFFHSGIRITEMLLVKGKDVDLQSQYLKCTIIKGGKKEEVLKTIKNIAVGFWKLALKGCGPEDYIFSRNLEPGQKSITSSMITRRYEIYGKDELGLTADYYTHKHGNTTEVVDEMGEGPAGELNSHKKDLTGKVIPMIKVYDTKSANRNHEKLKTAGNKYS